MRVEPYLFFEGTCRQAIDFYRRTLGAEVETIMRYKEAPETPPPGMVPPGWDDKVMHASFLVGETRVMASDGKSPGPPAFNGFSLSIAVPDVVQGECLFNALADGGKVTMPFGKTFWSPGFGMVTDRFGVSWMINTAS
ncbi:MAG TPA: VOC family protein [Burkholderiales bacterium]|nr:VOC family protein [Burkholderiales bacterium]